MWTWHDANDDAGAWADLLSSMAACVEVAEESDITLVFEPEVNHVVHTARKAQAATAQVGAHGLQWSTMPMDLDMMRECSDAEFAADLERLQRQMDRAQTGGVRRCREQALGVVYASTKEVLDRAGAR